MDKVFILGENSFIAKHLYLQIKKLSKYNIILLNHANYHELEIARDDDIIINFCGMNRSNTKIEYEEANHIFLEKIMTSLTSRPFLIHISSLMIYGFKDKDINSLSNYQKWFIKSKLNGEQYLCKNYPEKLLCIIRHSNIYGYDCVPYYNNLLSTLVYEKICGLNKINNININCFRNMLSVDNLSNQLYEFIENKKYGKYNLMSNNIVSLEKIVSYIYDNEPPARIVLTNGDLDIPNVNSDEIEGIDIFINENLQNEIKLLEENMKIFIQLKENISITNRNMLIQPRGNMVEITNLNSKRLYKITLTQHSVRGNHYHNEQIEDFFTNRDKVLYIFAYKNEPTIVYQYTSNINDLISVKPTIIHTLTNDFVDNNPEIIVSSTQEFIADNIPDTEYINII